MNNFEIRGDLTNPYHLSVGAVVTRNDTVAIIKKKGKQYTLLRETIHSHESIAAALIRGAQEELGVVIDLKRYLGGLLTHYERDGVKIEKTTAYFLCEYTGDTFMAREADELHDAIQWVSLDKARRLLASQENPEESILARI